MLGQRIQDYYATLSEVIDRSVATNQDGLPIETDRLYASVIDLVRDTAATGNRIYFVGNGGSAGICSHMAIDFTKNGKMPAMALSDASSLTCLSNDLGYENVFAFQLESHAKPGDLLIAISSSGGSPNILKAVEAARAKGMKVITFSGFSPENPLRRKGDVNIYIPSSEYGFVEVGHQAQLHAILDLAMGWHKQ